MPQLQGVIEFRGQEYPDRCSYCLAPIENSAVILLNTNLVIGFVGTRATNITIREEGDLQCMVS